MRIIVCGSRDFEDEDAVRDALLEHTTPYQRWQVTVVHGAARGADHMAEVAATDLEFSIERHPADWTSFGKSAGPRRNAEMAGLGADLCLAFWDGRSPGTAHMVTVATQAGIPVRIIPWKRK